MNAFCVPRFQEAFCRCEIKNNPDSGFRAMNESRIPVARKRDRGELDTKNNDQNTL